jgi:hypothetical protein
MLNNKKFFDVVTPMSDFHRKSRAIATTDGTNPYELDGIVPGLWVNNTKYGIMDAAQTVSGLSMLALSPAKKNEGAGVYEAHDTRVGYITVTNQPGVVCKAGAFFLEGATLVDANTGEILDSVIPGMRLTVNDNGKLQESASGDFTNAIISGRDESSTPKWIEYMIVSSYKEA